MTDDTESVINNGENKSNGQYARNTDLMSDREDHSGKVLKMENKKIQGGK